jgi:serine/threonine protein phosphatase PrpC
LFAVFDGHSDSNAAEYCANNFHKLLERYMKSPLEESALSDSELFGSEVLGPGVSTSSMLSSDRDPRSGTRSAAESEESGEEKTLEHYDYYEGYDEERLVNKNDEYTKQIKRAIFHAFEQASNQVLDKGYRSGCTACVVLIQQYIGKGNEPNYVWFANCGDARAVSFGGQTAV